VRARITPEHVKAWIAKNFEFRSRKGGQELHICNPDGDRAFRLNVSTVRKELHSRRGRNGKPLCDFWVNDYRPNHRQYNGSFIGFVRKYRGLTYRAAVREILSSCTGAVASGQVQDDERRAQAPVDLVDLPDGTVMFSERRDHVIRKYALNYLLSRSMDEQTVETAGLGYTPSTIVFPYHEYGEMVYWQERSFLAKSFNFPDEGRTGLRKTDWLYNFDNVEQPCPCLVVVESIFNCLSIGDDCVATGGAAMTEGGRQARKVLALAPEVLLFAPDADEAGAKSLRDHFFMFRRKCRLEYCLPPSGIDWNDMDRKGGCGTALRYLLGHRSVLDMSVLAAMV